LLAKHGEDSEDGNKEIIQYKTKTFSLSIDENIESFSMNIYDGFTLNVSKFIDFHIGFDENDKKKKTKTIGNDINSFSFYNDKQNNLEQEQEQNENKEKQKQLIYDEYVLEFGEPKSAKYLISFAKKKGAIISFSDAMNLMKKTRQSEKMKSLNDALLEVLGSEDDESENELVVNDKNDKLGLMMSRTLLSATPEPPNNDNAINEDDEMIYKLPSKSEGQSPQTPNSKKHKKNKSEMDKLYNMLENLDDDISKKRKKRKAKKKRSRSDFDGNYMILPKSPKITKSKPTTPKNGKKKHQRSQSTDHRRNKPLNLQELKTKNKERLKLKRSASKKKVHKMDYNLYDIDVRPNRRYRLLDGRICIAKFKGKVAFSKGSETYIGILVEHGEGAHDGTVDGKTYFRCKQGKGDFVRPFEVIQDLGRFVHPITEQMIQSGDHLIKEARQRLGKYEKKYNIKSNKKYRDTLSI